VIHAAYRKAKAERVVSKAGSKMLETSEDGILRGRAGKRHEEIGIILGQSSQGLEDSSKALAIDLSRVTGGQSNSRLFRDNQGTWWDVLFRNNTLTLARDVYDVNAWKLGVGGHLNGERR
jgi:hypothetical protein